MQRTMLFAQFAVIAILATLHLVALQNALYWKFQWFDLIAHFLGGMWAAFFFYWIGTISNRTSGFLLVLGGALLLGVVWEIFELTVGISLAPNYAVDTLTDLLMDILGALLAALVVRSVLITLRA